MSEQQEFLKDLATDQKREDVFDKPVTSEDSSLLKEEDESSEMKLHNRRERRLASRLQEEREANIVLNARLQGISEARKFSQEVGEADPIKAIRTIYGDDTPEKRQASDILENTLRKIQDTAVEKALGKIREDQTNESQAVRKEEENLDAMMENLEDEYRADFSDHAVRQGFLTLLERASPKDHDGNIIEYADPTAVWELYESRTKPSSNRAKELSSRSMTRSGSSQPSKLEDDATVRFLKENGII